MKTHFPVGSPTPEYDAQITNWLETYKGEIYRDAPRRVGILAEIMGVKVVYRALDGDSAFEIGAAYKFLESIGLVDFDIYNHPRFNCIYGLPEHRPNNTESISITCFGK
jgi:hypothetical protein